VRDLFVAGSETTASTLGWGILCLLHYPETQKKLYEEISAVVGEATTLEGVVLICRCIPLLQRFFHFHFAADNNNSRLIMCIVSAKVFDF